MCGRSRRLLSALNPTDSHQRKKKSKVEWERCHLITALQWEEPRTGTLRVCVLWEEAESMIGSDGAEDE